MVWQQVLGKERPLIAFLTDFGLADEWVALCKAVIWQRAPEAKVVDVTHLVPSYSVKAGALTLHNAALTLGAVIYLAVVDPGVGSQRRPLVLKTKNGAVLVGPDNGLLLPAAEVLGGLKEAIWLTNDEFWRRPVCPTFQARDIFAPVAAAVASGVALDKLGQKVDLSGLASAPWRWAVLKANSFQAEVLHIDNFGTVRFNITEAEVKKAALKSGQAVTLAAAKTTLTALLAPTFTAVKPQEPLFLVDSAKLLCLAINQGNAAQTFSLKVGQKVSLSWANR